MSRVSSKQARSKNVLVLEGKISELEEKDKKKRGQFYLITSKEKISHSGVMLESQGFGGSSEVNPYYSMVEVFLDEVLIRNFF